MKPEKLRSTLARLNKADLFLVLCYACLLWLRQRVGSLRPLHVLFPAVLSQIIFFAWAAYTSDNFLPVLALGNLTIVAIFIFPLTTQKDRPHCHWVTPSHGSDAL